MHKLLDLQDEVLLQIALTHRSYVNEHPGEKHNERLEFLGDSILNFVSGSYLYNRYPNVDEHEMTRRRAALVDEKQLAQFALEVGLDSRMRLGKGAIHSGGFQNLNLLSSTFEAVVGAYFLDAGQRLETLRPVLEELFDSVPEGIFESRSDVDAKNRFQEWAQATHKVLPQYVTERVGGPDHAPEYQAQVRINGQVYGEGKACGKKDAQKRAAEDAIARLKRDGLLG